MLRKYFAAYFRVVSDIVTQNAIFVSITASPYLIYFLITRYGVLVSNLPLLNRTELGCSCTISMGIFQPHFLRFVFPRHQFINIQNTSTATKDWAAFFLLITTPIISNPEPFYRAALVSKLG